MPADPTQHARELYPNATIAAKRGLDGSTYCQAWTGPRTWVYVPPERHRIAWHS